MSAEGPRIQPMRRPAQNALLIDPTVTTVVPRRASAGAGRVGGASG